MILDRSKFLTLAASIATATAAVACGGGGGDTTDDGSGDTAALATNHSSEQCYWDPAKEGTSRETQQFFAGDIGFDPVNNFSAAEGFCFRATGLDHASPSAHDFQSVQQLYLKCSSYAKLYVPQVVYWAYQKMHRESAVTWDTIYAIDHDIDQESGFCSTAAAKRTCTGEANHDECVRVATQLKPENQSDLKKCLDGSRLSPSDALYSCVEGGFRTYPPGQME